MLKRREDERMEMRQNGCMGVTVEMWVGGRISFKFKARRTT